MTWLRQHLSTVFWSLLLALAVWISAVTSTDPDEQRVFPTPIPIEWIGQDPSLVMLGEIPTQVEVTLRAPRSVWARLESQEKPVRATVDLSGLGMGEHLVRVQVQITERPTRVVLVSPAEFRITLEPLISRVFPVSLTLNGQPAIGYQAGDPVLTPTEVLVSGAQSLIEQVARARVTVNLSGTRESIKQAVDVQLYTSANQLVSGLSVNPGAVMVEIPVKQQGGYRDVAVKVIVKGKVADGYLLTNLSVFPPIVTVYSSDPELVHALLGVVETQPLDLSGASEDISTRLTLNLPPGISVVGEQTVQVNVTISPIQSNLTLSKIPITIVGLGEGFIAQVLPSEVDLILSGPAPLLDNLLLQDIQVIVDVTGLEPGTYQLNPQVNLLVANIVAESILPNTVEVQIQPVSVPEATATPSS